MSERVNEIFVAVVAVGIVDDECVVAGAAEEGIGGRRAGRLQRVVAEAGVKIGRPGGVDQDIVALAAIDGVQQVVGGDSVGVRGRRQDLELGEGPGDRDRRGVAAAAGEVDGPAGAVCRDVERILARAAEQRDGACAAAGIDDDVIAAARIDAVGFGGAGNGVVARRSDDLDMLAFVAPLLESNR